jgi:hypothetical protein
MAAVEAETHRTLAGLAAGGAIAPRVGGPKVVAAAPEIMLAMGLAIDEEGRALAMRLSSDG